MTDKPIARYGRGAVQAAALLSAAMPWLAGCESPFERIDRRTNELLVETNDELGPETEVPGLDWPEGEKPAKQTSDYLTREDPPTANPASRHLRFTPAQDGEQVMQRLLAYAQPPADGVSGTRSVSSGPPTPSPGSSMPVPASSRLK